MKFRRRPPLTLKHPAAAGVDAEAADALTPEAAPEAEGEHESTEPSLDAPAPTEAPAPAEAEPDAEPAAETEFQPRRPVMSERRRRRLAEEAARREAEAAALAEPAPQAEPAPEPAAEAPLTLSDARPTVAPMADPDAGAPPAPYQPAPPPAPLARAPLAPEPKGATVIASVASALWIGGVASWFAYEVGSGAVDLEPLRVAVYVLLALAPAGLALLLAHAMRQSARLAAETRRARELADSLAAPAALAAGHTGEVVLGLRGDIDQAVLATERARSDLLLLRETLAEETRRLNEAAEGAARMAKRLTDQLAQEREQMTALGGRLDSQAAGVVEAVERQSRMVADASDLAQTQLREAETALAARAADMAAAAGEAQDAARLASDDLARQTLRLENAGSGVAEQIKSVEEGLGQQRAALVTAAYALRTEQEDFSAQLESQRAQLIDQLSKARTAASEVDDISQRGADSLRELVEAATDQFKALMDMAGREADAFDAATKVALDKFDALAADARDAMVEETRRALEALQATADDARRAADAAAEQAQVRADRLGEALFDAAQKADAAADARIEDARRIVHGTTELVDAAGDEAVARLESSVARMGAALEMLREGMAELEGRSARLPETAETQMANMRRVVEDGLLAMADASRRAAQDTEALDTGFQERVRRNYDMLSETVRLMGLVSGEGTSGRRRETAPAPSPRPAAPPPSSSSERPRRERERERSREDSRGFGLRGRVGADAPAAGATPGREEPLDWDDLVAPAANEAPLELDQPVEGDLDGLTDRIVAAIRRMGVDPNALLPRSRLEEAAQALVDGGQDGPRQIVRRVAPAAVRSVSRRVLGDAELRAEVDRYVRAHGRELTQAARAEDVRDMTARLTTDAGRAWLLLDAAVGDLA